MKCTIDATEPSTLRDAVAGDLFLVRDPREHEAVFALLTPTAPTRCVVTNDIALIKCIAIACRAGPPEPGYHYAGEQMMFPPDTVIQFVEQVGEAKFAERATNLNLRVHVTFVVGGGGSGKATASGGNGKATEPDSKPGDQL